MHLTATYILLLQGKTCTEISTYGSAVLDLFIFPVLSILIESFAVILLCFEFALISPERFFTFVLGYAFLRSCLLCFKAGSDGEHQCLEYTECS